MLHGVRASSISDNREHFQAFLVSICLLFGELVQTSADEQKCYFKATGSLLV